MNDGSSSYSTSATSGAPEPALIALVIATYSGSPAPTSSWVTQMPGCDWLNAVTARPRPGTHAQKVIFTALLLAQLAPASTVTDELGLAAPDAAALELPALDAADEEAAAAGAELL